MLFSKTSISPYTSHVIWFSIEKIFCFKKISPIKGMKVKLLKKMILTNQIFMKQINYLMTLLKIVEIVFFIHSIIDLFMTLNLQRFLIFKKSISKLLIDLWSLKLNFRVWKKISKKWFWFHSNKRTNNKNL